jgi:hypothetical protein
MGQNDKRGAAPETWEHVGQWICLLKSSNHQARGRWRHTYNELIRVEQGREDVVLCDILPQVRRRDEADRAARIGLELQWSELATPCQQRCARRQANLDSSRLRIWQALPFQGVAASPMDGSLKGMDRRHSFVVRLLNRQDLCVLRTKRFLPVEPTEGISQ